jgi:hypothetical protein
LDHLQQERADLQKVADIDGALLHDPAAVDQSAAGTAEVADADVRASDGHQAVLSAD